MDELVNNLKHCLDFFKLPDIEVDTADRNFIRASIEKWKKDYDIYDTMKFMPLDGKYFICDEKAMKAIIDWDWTDNKKYVIDKYDCENFAFSFKAMVDKRFGLNNVGLVIDYSGSHAYNIIVFKNGSVKIFEPQSDRWAKAGTKLYKFQSGYIKI